MKVQEYILKEAYSFGPLNDQRTLPSGSFVKPMNIAYVPKHCLKDNQFNYHPETDQFCFTRYGFIPIPKKLIMEVTW